MSRPSQESLWEFSVWWSESKGTCFFIVQGPLQLLGNYEIILKHRHFYTYSLCLGHFYYCCSNIRLPFKTVPGHLLEMSQSGHVTQLHPKLSGTLEVRTHSVSWTSVLK